MLDSLLLSLAALAPQQVSLLVDLEPGLGDSAPASFVRAGDFVFLRTGVQDPFGPSDYDWWSTDGSAAGALELPSTSTSILTTAAPLGGRVVFSTACSNFPCAILNITDGSAAGTGYIDVPGGDEYAPGWPMAEFGGRLFYGNVYSDTYPAMWVTDGTAAGTSEFHSGFGFVGGSSARTWPTQFLAVEDRLFWRSGAYPTDNIGSTDGTQASVLLEAPPTSNELSLMGAVGDRCVYFERYGDGRIELRSVASGDPAPVGLGELSAALPPGPPYLKFTPSAVAVNGRLLMLQRLAGGAQQLVSTDGVTPGFATVLDLAAYESMGDPTAGTLLLFSDAEFGQTAFLLRRTGGPVELWFSDGTAAGTAKAADLPFDLNEQTIGPVALFADQRVAFSGIEPGGAGRLWIGSPLGAFPAFEPRSATGPGQVLSIPRDGVLGSVLLLSARTPLEGAELHAVPLSALGAPTAIQLSGGCANTGAPVPSLGNGGQLAINTVATFQLSDATPLSTSLWFRDLGLNSLGPIGSCSIALPAPVFSASLQTDAAGRAAWTPLTPAIPALAGLAIRLQALVLDAGGGPAFGLGSLSDALEITLTL